MGTWGYDPSENDASHDIFDSLVQRHVDEELLRRFVTSRDDKPFAIWERLGFLQIVWEHKMTIPERVAHYAMLSIGDLLADPDFWKEWRDPAEARLKLEALRAKLNETPRDLVYPSKRRKVRKKSA